MGVVLSGWLEAICFLMLVSNARFISDWGVLLGVVIPAGRLGVLYRCEGLADGGVSELVMSMTNGDASDDSSVLSTLIGVCLGVSLNPSVCLGVCRSFDGVVRSIRNMDESRLVFFEVDGVLKSIRSRLQLSSFSSESTLPLGVLYTLLGVETAKDVVV